jgi:hypothetical protein
MQKIYFGNVEIQHKETGETRTIEKKVFKELDSPTDKNLKSYILKDIRPIEREKYIIKRFCFDTAKQMGNTAY